MNESWVIWQTQTVWKEGSLLFKDMSLARNAKKHETITRYYKCPEKGWYVMICAWYLRIFQGFEDYRKASGLMALPWPWHVKWDMQTLASRSWEFKILPNSHWNSPFLKIAVDFFSPYFLLMMIIGLSGGRYKMIDRCNSFHSMWYLANLVHPAVVESKAYEWGYLVKHENLLFACGNLSYQEDSRFGWLQIHPRMDSHVYLCQSCSE